MTDNSLKSITSDAKSILVMLPASATFDEVASATSIYLALIQEGKEITIYSPNPMVVEFNRLIAVNKIKTEIGNKNLSLSFSNYDPQGIEKVSWDIDGGEFKLTVVPKIGISAPSQDQIKINYVGVAADTVIMVGGNNEESFANVKTEDLSSANLVHIGVNQLNITQRNVSSLATSASSISEVTANLIKNSGYKMEADVATNLLMGIEETTHEFTTTNVTADTFQLVSELMRAGGKRLNQGQVQAADFPVGAIPGMPAQVPPSWTEPKIFKGTNLS
jgi:hypothetical protein